MKRALIIALCIATTATAATTATTAQAQTPAQKRIATSYSGTEYYKYSGKEYSKVWVQADPGDMKMRAEHFDPATGKRHIVIFREGRHILPGTDREEVTREMYSLDPDAKTGFEMTIDEVQNMGTIIGLVAEDGRTTKKEFIGLENINGYECHHYQTTITTVLVTGVEETGCVHSWIYEPLGVQMQSANCGYDEPITLKDFRQGPQPAHLFEIPDDYQLLDAGAMMQEAKGVIDGFKEVFNVGNKKAAEQQKQLDAIDNSGASEQDKLIEALKMLGGAGK